MSISKYFTDIKINKFATYYRNNCLFFLNKQTHFNDQESPIDCDDGEVASTSNRARTTTIATVNTNLPQSSQDNQLPSRSTNKTNAETQTALRGVSLMEMIQRSTTTGTVDDIESGKCHNGECKSGAPGNNKVLI